MTEEEEAAMSKYPTKVIIYRGKTAPEPVQPRARTTATKDACSKQYCDLLKATTSNSVTLTPTH
jgi:hypothetical protein